MAYGKPKKMTVKKPTVEKQPSKNTKVPTSADKVGQRKAYRMTGKLSG